MPCVRIDSPSRCRLCSNDVNRPTENWQCLRCNRSLHDKAEPSSMPSTRPTCYLPSISKKRDNSRVGKQKRSLELCILHISPNRTVRWQHNVSSDEQEPRTLSTRNRKDANQTFEVYKCNEQRMRSKTKIQQCAHSEIQVRHQGGATAMKSIFIMSNTYQRLVSRQPDRR